MPTYEFRCPNGHDFEKFYKTMSTAPSELPCPECDAVSARQLSGGGGFVFKGSGFYLTDYGKNAHRGGAPEKQGDAAASDGGKADGAKPESKSDAKSDSKADSTSSKSDSRSDAKSDSKSASKGGGEPTKPKASGAEPKASKAKPSTE